MDNGNNVDPIVFNLDDQVRPIYQESTTMDSGVVLGRTQFVGSEFGNFGGFEWVRSSILVGEPGFERVRSSD